VHPEHELTGPNYEEEEETETLGERAPSYATVKNLVAQFKRGNFLPFFFLVGLRTYQHLGIFNVSPEKSLYRYQSQIHLLQCHPS
jgi:hypothetical protein